MTRFFLLCLMLIAGFCGVCGSIASVDTLSTDTLFIEKARFRGTLRPPVISPEGKKAVVPVSVSGAPADSLATHIWLLDLQTKMFRQFTNSTKSESDPKWSPDGRQLAFVSARGGS